MKTQRPRVSRLQFSLRAVLVIVTLTALAGWWWQKRFTVESTVQQQRMTDNGAEVVELTKTQSVRRKGLDKVVRDGPTTVVDSDGGLISEEEWRQGRRHGIYRRWDDEGELLFDCELRLVIPKWSLASLAHSIGMCSSIIQTTPSTKSS
jgi:hypothetical protein